MTAIQALYDELLPRRDNITGYANDFPLDKMPEVARRLFDLSLALAEMAPAVELYRQPEVVDGFPLRSSCWWRFRT